MTQPNRDRPTIEDHPRDHPTAEDLPPRDRLTAEDEPAHYRPTAEDAARDRVTTEAELARDRPTLEDQPQPTTPHGLPAELAERLRNIEHMERGGGQARLFLADWADGTCVVVKVFHNSDPVRERTWRMWLGADDEHVRRVAPLLFAETLAGSDCEVTQYLPHGSLSDHSATRIGPFSDEEAETVLRELTAALRHVHARPADVGASGYWVHGDIKPANVLLRTADPMQLCPERVKIFEAGSSRYF